MRTIIINKNTVGKRSATVNTLAAWAEKFRILGMYIRIAKGNRASIKNSGIVVERYTSVYK